MNFNYIAELPDDEIHKAIGEINLEMFDIFEESVKKDLLAKTSSPFDAAFKKLAFFKLYNISRRIFQTVNGNPKLLNQIEASYYGSE